jgi:hypothetical protein
MEQVELPEILKRFAILAGEKERFQWNNFRQIQTRIDK